MTNIEKIAAEIDHFQIENNEQLEQFRLQFLSKKSELQTLLGQIKEVAPEERKAFGQQVNELKQKAQQIFDEQKERLESSVVFAGGAEDYSRPVPTPGLGSLHPISVIMNEVCTIFEDIGFHIVDGPEIEDDWHVFSALNFAEEHPARDMQDTFFIELRPDVLLRTHTSSVQVRAMESQKPPLRVICPGRVYRNEVITARSHCFFHQMEALYVAENVSFADMKQTLLHFAREMFGAETEIRLRPSYFPFTEPSAEMDISCKICGGKGCTVCKHTGWVEILGCGMVDPNVLDSCGIDSTKYTGYAIGIGIERMTMLKYKINDIRLFFENDIRFLQQFKSTTL
ncbi:phenylalanine--tRNA ligase subunit alpha [Bacteroidales bacterium OttesenSCG-928-B11]|nr:phenylalanine--tRNA ligase subunit alpha [Bacteroidales bacterium OttesenSCG-928-E04]MDL2312603.1 phenylalanine--tRNA ligase subunit alpha [Bacteroidales bacterium OttesenSCG-928-B11]